MKDNLQRGQRLCSDNQVLGEQHCDVEDSDEIRDIATVMEGSAVLSTASPIWPISMRGKVG